MKGTQLVTGFKETIALMRTKKTLDGGTGAVYEPDLGFTGIKLLKPDAWVLCKVPDIMPGYAAKNWKKVDIA